VHPDANFAGLHQVSDSGVRDLLSHGETCQDGRDRDGEKQLFHLSLQRLPVVILNDSPATGEMLPSYGEDVTRRRH
jgi:hypothetical protein